MPIITFTSDLGLQDHYVAVVKGKIATECNGVQVIDISHSIMPFSIGHAGFLVKNSYRHFPPSTIHMICVNNEAYKDNNYLLAEHNDHYFLAGDNGVFSVIFDGKPDKIYE